MGCEALGLPWIVTIQIERSHGIKTKMIIPMVVCLDAAAEINFYQRAFSAVVLSRHGTQAGP